LIKTKIKTNINKKGNITKMKRPTWPWGHKDKPETGENVPVLQASEAASVPTQAEIDAAQSQVEAPYDQLTDEKLLAENGPATQETVQAVGSTAMPSEATPEAVATTEVVAPQGTATVQ
jgi:hypothetical protein